MKRQLIFSTLLWGLIAPLSCLHAAEAVKTDAAKTEAAKAEGQAPASGHRVFVPADIKWVEGPASLPKGAKVFVLHGDPNAPGIFAIRVRIPAGYKVPPHFHPADEHVTVLSGTFSMGMGDTWNDANMRALPAGSFSMVPTGAHHYAGSRTGAVIQVHAMGPWGITYVNPKDDPRNQKPATK